MAQNFKKIVCTVNISISRFHTIRNIPALLLKNTLRLLYRAGIFRIVLKGDIIQTSEIVSIKLIIFSFDFIPPSLPKLAGKWEITKSESTREYFEALGINSLLARMMSNIEADVTIEVSSSGFKKISTTKGILKQTVVQEFEFDETTSFTNPLTGATEFLSIVPDTSILTLEFDHEGKIFLFGKLFQTIH
jgi:hypothetical protein